MSQKLSELWDAKHLIRLYHKGLVNIAHDHGALQQVMTRIGKVSLKISLA
jgi:hypothetical protein